MRNRNPMRCRQTAKIMTLDDTTKPSPLRARSHIHLLTHNKMSHRDGITHLQPINPCGAKFLAEGRHRHLFVLLHSLLIHAAHRFADILFFSHTKSQTHPLIARLFLRKQRHHMTRLKMQQRHRNVRAIRRESTTHAHLLHPQTVALNLSHVSISTLTPEVKSSFMRSSIVCGGGSAISMRRL